MWVGKLIRYVSRLKLVVWVPIPVEFLSCVLPLCISYSQETRQRLSFKHVPNVLIGSRKMSILHEDDSVSDNNQCNNINIHVHCYNGKKTLGSVYNGWVSQKRVYVQSTYRLNSCHVIVLWHFSILDQRFKRSTTNDMPYIMTFVYICLELQWPLCEL